jgi:putative ABC transport system permease protein
MREKSTTPNNNIVVIKMLSKKLEKSNKGRNRILLGAVVLCIVTLTMVFGISYGKIQAEYIKAIRKSGMAASTVYKDADKSQYEKVKELAYIKQVGKRVIGGSVKLDGQPDCSLQWLDGEAWNKMVKPAYTEIHGSYPEKGEDIMLSASALKSLNVNSPKEGMEIELSVNIGFFQTKQEIFKLCGWYTDYVKDNARGSTGYVSRTKLQDWGYHINERADLLICQLNHLKWQETEARLYKDVPTRHSAQKILAANTYAYDAVNQLVGSYELAILGAIVILGGLFFLIQNVLHISMAGDIRQLGLLNTIGTTRKQLTAIYDKQIRHILLLGIFWGMLLSAFVLLVVIPIILGKQYLQGFGGTKELSIFRYEILIAAMLSTAFLTMGVAAYVIRKVVNSSCVESMYYTGLVPQQRKNLNKKTKQARKTRRSENKELLYMSWQNVIRYRTRFLLTVFSLFLGMETFIGAIVITTGSDYMHVIEKRPDFLVAGQFSKWGQESGYGNEYKMRDAGEDPMKTEGDSFQLLYANEYDEFSPISPEVKEKLLKLQGVNEKKSNIAEGAYMISTISAKGIRPFTDKEETSQEDDQKKEGVGYYGSAYKMVQGFNTDVIQVLNKSEMQMLRSYVEQNNLPVDMSSLEEGTGVMILHDHILSPTQEKQAEEGIGEPLYFTSLLSREDKGIWNQASDKEKDQFVNSGQLVGKKSEMFQLCGYLDNQAQGFPDIRQTWHGAEGDIYYLISEKGFEKLPTEKKTLYMELNVKQSEEAQVKSKIQEIIFVENQKRAQMIGTAVDDDSGEAGIFCISKSDLLAEASNYIRGNRLILGSISAVLLLAGFMNYFNVMATGILSRKRELEVMHSIGMTEKQKRKLLIAEGGYYCIAVMFLMITVGSLVFKLVSRYMQEQLSYFKYNYPLGWIVALGGGMWVICITVVWFLCHIESRGEGRGFLFRK